MAKISTKHPDRQKTFGFKSFSEGMNEELSPKMLSAGALAMCRNMKYVLSKADDGSSRVTLKKRQGTKKISTVGLLDFNALSQSALAWYGMTAAPGGNIYSCVYNGDIYMQTAGTGTFSALSQTTRNWYAMTAAPNGNVYAAVYNGDIYMQTAGTGNFAALSQTSRLWRSMAADASGNIYASVSNGDIYLQTAGTGNFAALSQTSRDWYGMAVAPNGNVYAADYGGDIYMRTAGAGDFAALGQTSRLWRGMAVAPNGNVYASVNGGDLYMQTGGAGDFVALNQTSRSWRSMAANTSGNVYVAVTDGDIYMQTAGTGVMAETRYVSQNQYIVASDTKLYYLDVNSAPVLIGSISGIPTFTEFNGKLIIHDGGVTKSWDGTTFSTINNLVEDLVIETGDGATVDFTGTLADIPVESGTVTITYTAGSATKTITDSAGSLIGDVTQTQMITNAYNRVFDCTGGDINWDVGDCFLAAVSYDYDVVSDTQYQSFYLPVAYAPMTVGRTYTLSFTASIGTGNSWKVLSHDSSQTFSTANITTVANTAYSYTFVATTTGGIRFKNETAGAGEIRIDDVSLIQLNKIDTTTGAYSFTCSTAPDNTTSVYITYEQTDKAPKSTAGLVRASRLYMWVDSDHPSRLWYSGVNDEEAWDDASGGYIDVDVNDGYSLLGVVNYYESMVLGKGNSLHRLDNFPGDTGFDAIPLIDNIGPVASNTYMNDGNLISFLSHEGWVALSSAEVLDSGSDSIKKTTDLSEKFHKTCVKGDGELAYSEYNKIDKQLWLTPYDGSNYSDDIYVVSLATGGQLSLYRFAFGHSSYKFVDGEMLIGGKDGNLYKLVDDDSTFLDNGVSYASTTSFKTGFVDFGLPFNRKHNKKIMVDSYAPKGYTATMNLHKDNTTELFTSDAISLSLGTGTFHVNPDGLTVEVYDTQSTYVNDLASMQVITRHFNYKSLMCEITNIAATGGVEFNGIDFLGAVIGL